MLSDMVASFVRCLSQTIDERKLQLTLKYKTKSEIGCYFLLLHHRLFKPYDILALNTNTFLETTITIREDAGMNSLFPLNESSQKSDFSDYGFGKNTGLSVFQKSNLQDGARSNKST